MAAREDGEATRLIGAGFRGGRASRTVGPPVERGSTVLMPDAASLYDDSLVSYGRAGLGVQAILCDALAELEGARTVQLFPSGLAALAGAMLAVLKAGDDVLVCDTIYNPTRRFCEHVLRRFGVGVRYYPPRTPPSDLLALTTASTRLIVIESPGSLTFEMQDAPGIAAEARARGVLTLMDNTWAAGLLFKPLAHGVDISVQALTKYVGGHSDVFMGSAATARGELGDALNGTIRDYGWSVAPEDAYQMLRGLRTLSTRMERHAASGLAVAAWLRDHPAVAEVLYPALPGAPDHALWKRDYSGAAAVFSMVFKPCSDAAVAAFLDGLRTFRLGYSWGGFESLALNCDPQFYVREWPPRPAGPSVRLSIGLEDPADLIADLERGFAAMAAI